MSIRTIWMVVLGAVLLWASSSEAACTGSSPTFTAASAALADIQACVTRATGGDIINVPFGSANWSGNTLSLTKGVQIIGAGIGNTVITSGYVNYTPSSGNWAANYAFRLSGFSWLGAGAGGSFLTLDAGCAVPRQTNMRVDHNRISNYPGTAGAMFNYGFRGVVDNNIFDLNGYTMRVGWGDHGGCSGTSGYGAGHWQFTKFGLFDFGDLNTTIYFEDNVFTGIDRIITDGDEGGSYVFRYNSMDGPTNGQLFDLHNHNGGAGDWPTRGAEVYGNVWTNGAGYWMKNQGSGRTLMFNNLGAGGGSWYVGDNACAQNSAEYPGIALQTNNTYWFNTRPTVTGTLETISAILTIVCNGRQVNQLNQSLWQDNTSWTPGQALTSGVAKGTLANRPTTCTPGTAYWATNQSVTNLTGMTGPNPSTHISGTLYQCSNVAYGPNGYDPTAGTANTWVELFTPAPYPHPLRTNTQQTALDISSGPPSPPPKSPFELEGI